MTLEERLVELLQASKKWINTNLRQSKLTQLLDVVIDGLENIVNPAVRDAAEKKQSDVAAHNAAPTQKPVALSPAAQKRTEAVAKRRAQEAELNRITPFSYIPVPPTKAKDLLPPEPAATPAQVDISRPASMLDQAAMGMTSPQMINKPVKPVYGQPVDPRAQQAAAVNSLSQQPKPYVASPVNASQQPSGAQPYLAKPAPANAQTAKPKAPGVDPQTVAAAGVVAANEAQSTYKSPTPFDSMRRGPRPKGPSAD